MAVRVAINGFGRIGRLMFRRAYELGIDDIEIVAINNLSDNKQLSHLLKYDSSYGIFEPDVEPIGDDYIQVGDKKIRYFQERDPAKVRWGDEKVDIVLEATGVFTKVEDASKHLHSGVKKVIVTAVCKGGKQIICMGVNEETYDPSIDLTSNASCTTNCMAPVSKVLNDTFGIKRGLMTTIHSYTNDQNILDLPHRKDMRRARAAASNIIPTTTGAADAVGLVIPELHGKLTGMAFRVPTPTVSVLDATYELNKTATAEEVNAAFKAAADGPMNGVLGYTDKPLVSMDFKGDSHSAIIDSLSTLVMEGNLVKVVAWYDNEWGYSCRVIDLTRLIASKL